MLIFRSALLRSISSAIWVEFFTRKRNNKRILSDTFTINTLADRNVRICRSLEPIGLGKHVLTHLGEIILFDPFITQIKDIDGRRMRILRNSSCVDIEIINGIEMTPLYNNDGSLACPYPTISILLDIFYHRKIKTDFCNILTMPNRVELVDLYNRNILEDSNISSFQYSEYFNLDTVLSDEYYSYSEMNYIEE